MAVLTIYLGTDEQDIWLDSPLGTIGAVAGEITIQSETCAVTSGLGSRHLRVERASGGSTAATHAIGTTVTLSNAGTVGPAANVAALAITGGTAAAFTGGTAVATLNDLLTVADKVDELIAALIAANDMEAPA